MRNTKLYLPTCVPLLPTMALIVIGSPSLAWLGVMERLLTENWAEGILVPAVGGARKSVGGKGPVGGGGGLAWLAGPAAWKQRGLGAVVLFAAAACVAVALVVVEQVAGTLAVVELVAEV